MTNCRRGVTSVEYALIASIVAASLVISLHNFVYLKTLISSVGDAFQAAINGTP